MTNGDTIIIDYSCFEKLLVLVTAVAAIYLLSSIVGCSTTNPNSTSWDYNEYMATDYQNTPDWIETEKVLSEIDTPEKVAFYMGKRFRYYDTSFRLRNYRKIDDMQFLNEAIPPPSRFVNSGGITCITAANFARIALEKHEYNVFVLRMHTGNLSRAYKSIGSNNASLHYVCLVDYKGALYSVGDTFGPVDGMRNIRSKKLQGPWKSTAEFIANYNSRFKMAQLKMFTSQMPNYGHVPEKEKCRGVSCE